MGSNDFTKKVIQIIKNIPKGKILTYGHIAKMAGSASAARQVSWILHSSSKKYDLPWHRVISSKGIISLKLPENKDYQKLLLEREGIKVSDDHKVDLTKYLWKAGQPDLLNPEDFLN
jgi:methylated-DNA-protein-cysteine methyltransferase related protein